MRAWKRWRLLTCDDVFDVAAFSCWSFACVCDISGLKNTRDWVGGKKKNGNCKSFTELDTVIILAINYGKALQLDCFLPYICFQYS